MLADVVSGFGIGAGLGVLGAVLLGLGALTYAFVRSLTVLGWCVVIGLTLLALTYL